jgi:hypothetical protein
VLASTVDSRGRSDAYHLAFGSGRLVQLDFDPCPAAFRQGVSSVLIAMLVTVAREIASMYSDLVDSTLKQ